MHTNEKRIDWQVFWAAAGVLVAVLTVNVSCFVSLNNSITRIENRLTKIETILILKGMMPESMAHVDNTVAKAK